nr:competence protein CoiA family protein [uncultured Draconibacterium sp.]
MLTAIRKIDNVKVTGDVISKKKDDEYYCEYCKKDVVHHLAEARIKIGHFKHKSGDSYCPNQSKETEYHFNTKLDIYNYILNGWGANLKSIELEKWICNNTIRPDIYIETYRSKIAIEVQATILTVSEIKKRTERYCKNDIHVLWILPFQYDRFWEYNIVEPAYDGLDAQYSWMYAEKVKLKEMEIFLYWAYYKKLLFWDLEHKHSNTFVCIGLSEHKSEDVEFWRDGEEHYYHGKTAKTLKKINWIRYDIKFSELTTAYAPEFKAPFRSYIIPERELLTYDNRKRLKSK